MESGAIPNNKITASGWNKYGTKPGEPWNGRLNSRSWGWVNHDGASKQQYIQIDLGVKKKINAIATQGSFYTSDRVKKYRIAYHDGSVYFYKINGAIKVSIAFLRCVVLCDIKLL